MPCLLGPLGARSRGRRPRADCRRRDEILDVREVSVAAGGKHLQRVDVILNRNADLLDLVLAVRPPSRLAGRLDRRQQERHEDADDRNDHQQLDKRKARRLKRLAAVHVLLTCIR